MIDWVIIFIYYSLMAYMLQVEIKFRLKYFNPGWISIPRVRPETMGIEIQPRLNQINLKLNFTCNIYK